MAGEAPVSVVTAVRGRTEGSRNSGVEVMKDGARLGRVGHPRGGPSRARL